MKRSPYSLEFERLWRTLRSDQKLIPDKSEFKPHLFKHLLPQIGLCEIDTEKKTMIVSLIGEKIRQIAGLDMRGLDLNTWADPKNLPARLERQRLYHDIPVGRADVIEFRYADGVTAFYELTYLPLYGLNNERILTMFFSETDRPKNYLSDFERMLQFGYFDETFIDIGGGLPVLEHGIREADPTEDAKL